MKTVQDYYFNKAKSEKHVARSIYKLKEIQNKFRILKNGQRVLDLGASPGSWLQYVSKVVGSKGFVLGIDLKKLEINLPENVSFLQANLNEIDPKRILQHSKRFDVIISDMAPKTTGIKHMDAERSCQLSLLALDFAKKYLSSAGSLVVKVFQGNSVGLLRNEIKKEFKKINTFKPKSSRNESVETFIIGRKNILR